MTAVAIVEPHRMTRLGIERAVCLSAGLRVVASVADPADLDGSPAVVILSSRACQPSPTAVVGELRRQAAVLVMVDTPNSADLRSSVRAGACGFVTTDVSESELASAVRAVADGAFYLMAALTPFLHTELDRGPAAGAAGKALARREIEALRLIASGYTHGQVARRMGVTEASVNTYVKRIRAKLKVGNKAELTRRAIDLGYVSTEAPAALRTA